MALFRRRKDRSATATLNPDLARAAEIETAEGPAAAVSFLTEANRENRDPQLDRELRAVRHRLGVSLLENANAGGEPPVPAEFDFTVVDGIPEVEPGQLSPEVLRAAILEFGCLKVKGVMDPDRAHSIADGIEQAFVDRAGQSEGQPAGDDSIYDPFSPQSPYQVVERGWVAEGGGVLACDAPPLMFDMLDAFETSGLTSMIEGYLGEQPAVSAQKCTLRKAEPTVNGAWHQDGRFMGDVKAMNVWLALSRCGDVAPGMDMVPTRLEEYVETGTEGTYLESQISQAKAEEAAEGVGIFRPCFDPGDALLFDEMFLHQTGSDPDMPNPRFAIESWFFAPSAFPEDYAPIAA